MTFYGFYYCNKRQELSMIVSLSQMNEKMRHCYLFQQTMLPKARKREETSYIINVPSED